MQQFISELAMNLFNTFYNRFARRCRSLGNMFYNLLAFLSTCSTTGLEFWQELYDMNHKAESDLDGSITKAEFNVKMVISDVFGARDGLR